MVGETPNLAARLQALAEPGTVVIAEGTRRLLGGLFELRDLGPRALKGFAEPVRGLPGRSASAAESRFEALHAGPAARRWSGATRSWRCCSSAGSRPRRARARSCCSRRGRDRQVAAGPGRCATRSRASRTPRCATSARPTTPDTRALAGRSSSSSARRASARRRRRERRLDKLEALLRHGGRRRRRGRAAARALLGDRPARPLPAAATSRPQQRQRTARWPSLVDQLAGLAAPAAGADGARGRALDRPDHARAARARARADRAARRCCCCSPSGPTSSPPWAGTRTSRGSPSTASAAARPRRSSARLTGGQAPARRRCWSEIVARTDGVPLFVEELTKAVLEAGAGRRRYAAVGRCRPSPARTR